MYAIFRCPISQFARTHTQADTDIQPHITKQKLIANNARPHAGSPMLVC
jgi:hypothetical protein